MFQFQSWDGFYALTGTASASLIGLLFVVATLARGRDDPHAERGVALYTTPTVFHFAVVLAVSAMALAPKASAWLETIALGAVAVAGVLYAGARAAAIRRGKDSPLAPHWSDFWFYGAAPTGIYVALALTAAMAWAAPRRAPYGVAMLLLALLLVAIRNAWDLVTFLAPKRPPADS